MVLQVIDNASLVKKEKEEYWAKFSTWIKDNQLNKDKV